MVQRFGQVIGLNPQHLSEYRRAHQEIWPEIADALKEAGIYNYTIYHRDGLLFGTFEYHGPPDEFKLRMDQLAKAPRMREWWDWMEPMQIPLEDRSPEEWWANMEEVFHLD